MSRLLFLDESGHDRKDSPYEVLAGICIEDKDLWNFICEIQGAETTFFGRRISAEEFELKAKKLLKRKTFRLASQMSPFNPAERTELARQCLEKGKSSKGNPEGSGATKSELTALAQAKIAFVKHLLELCALYRVKAFASIVDSEAPRPAGDFLRKDYSYLFERYYYFLDTLPHEEMGLVVFDELERAQCHILIDQMARYFRETAKGKARASRIIPEPFFVHSHLTTAIQIADLIAYIIAWGVSVGNMNRERRAELAELAALVVNLRYFRKIIGDDEQEHILWSFVVIYDLRPRAEREDV